MNWQEHSREVFSVNFNLVRKDVFVTGSWDLSIKLWKPDALKSLVSYNEHSGCVYCTIWSPRNADLFASCSGDGTFKIFDARRPVSVQTVVAHSNEVLGIDWNKYREHEVSTCSVDKTIKQWDLRMAHKEIGLLLGHEFAVRRIKYSPHSPDLLASVSYDTTVKLWNVVKGAPVFEFHEHSEFVWGLDFSLFDPKLLVTCGWDDNVFFIPI